MPSYFYNWEDGFSTDPDWNKMPSNQRRNPNITCDGNSLSRVLCCLTGKNGFVKNYATDSERNAIAIIETGKCLTKIRFGRVTIEYKKEQ